MEHQHQKIQRKLSVWIPSTNLSTKAIEHQDDTSTNIEILFEGQKSYASLAICVNFTFTLYKSQNVIEVRAVLVGGKSVDGQAPQSILYLSNSLIEASCDCSEVEACIQMKKEECFPKPMTSEDVMKAQALRELSVTFIKNRLYVLDSKDFEVSMKVLAGDTVDQDGKHTFYVDKSEQLKLLLYRRKSVLFRRPPEATSNVSVPSDSILLSSAKEPRKSNDWAASLRLLDPGFAKEMLPCVLEAKSNPEIVDLFRFLVHRLIVKGRVTLMKRRLERIMVNTEPLPKSFPAPTSHTSEEQKRKYNNALEKAKKIRLKLRQTLRNKHGSVGERSRRYSFLYQNLSVSSPYCPIKTFIIGDYEVPSTSAITDAASPQSMRLSNGKDVHKKVPITPTTMTTINSPSKHTSGGDSESSVNSPELPDVRRTMRRSLSYVGGRKEPPKISINSLDSKVAVSMSQLLIPPQDHVDAQTNLQSNSQSNHRAPQSIIDTTINTETQPLSSSSSSSLPSLSNISLMNEEMELSLEDSSQIARQIIARPSQLVTDKINDSNDDHDDYDHDSRSVGDSENLNHRASPTAFIIEQNGGESVSPRGRGLLSPLPPPISSLPLFVSSRTTATKGRDEDSSITSFVSPTVNRTSVLGRGYGSHNELDALVSTEQLNHFPIQQRRASASPLSLSPSQINLSPTQITLSPTLLDGSGGSGTKAGVKARASSIDVGSGMGNNNTNTSNSKHPRHLAASQSNIVAPVNADRASQSNVMTPVKADHTSPSSTSIKTILADSRREQDTNTDTNTHINTDTHTHTHTHIKINTNTITARPATATSTAQIVRSRARSQPMLLLPLLVTKDKQTVGGSIGTPSSTTTTTTASSAVASASSFSVLASQSSKTTKDVAKVNPSRFGAAPSQISQSNLTAPSQLSLSSKANSSRFGTGGNRSSLRPSTSSSTRTSSSTSTSNRTSSSSIPSVVVQDGSHVPVPISTPQQDNDEVTPSRSHLMMKGLRNGRSLAQLFGDVFGSQNTMSESLRLTTERLVQESEQQRLQQLQQQQQEDLGLSEGDNELVVTENNASGLDSGHGKGSGDESGEGSRVDGEERVTHLTDVTFSTTGKQIAAAAVDEEFNEE